MDDLGSLLATTASWVAPGAPQPDTPEGLARIRPLFGSPTGIAAMLRGQVRRVAGYYEATHPLNVAILGMAVAHALGLGPEDEETLVRAALVHDLGMRLLPAPIRYKVGSLNPEELCVLRRHPELSSQLAEAVCGSAVAAIVRAHHERWDGSGYPRNLAGPDIPLLSRILMVADVFDAMCSDRIYIRRYSPALAHQAVRASAGRALDPDVAAAFLSAVAPFPPSTAVRLASGETGVVVATVPERPFRPVVMLDDGSVVEGRDVAGLHLQRGAPRFTAGVPLRARWAGEALEGRTINLSAEGAGLIDYSGKICQGGDLELSFRPRSGPGLDLTARIVWSRPSAGSGRLVGTWFGPLAEDLRAAVMALAGAECETAPNPPPQDST